MALVLWSHRLWGDERLEPSGQGRVHTGVEHPI